MLELPHAMVGAAIASVIPDPVISLPLAILSHFITDYVPHWNPHLGTEKKLFGHYKISSLVLIIMDCSLAIIFGLAIAKRSPHPEVILAACLLAVLPDVVEIPHFFFNMKVGWIERLLDYQKNHQWNVKPIYGIISQLIVIGICFYFILSA